MSDTSKSLRKAADEIENEGHLGWGNTCRWAADEFDALAARLAHAEACLAEKHLRLAEAERDAVRYRWLRSQPMRDGCDLVHVELMDWNEDGPTHVWYAYDADGLDAAIDAAMGEKP